MGEGEFPRVGAGAPVPVLALLVQDAKRTCDFLASAGVKARACNDIDELCAAVTDGYPPAALVAEEALTGHLLRLAAILTKQPPGSDLAVLVLVAARRTLLPDPQCTELMDVLGNAVLLTRPIHPITLLSVVRAAVRAHRHRLRDYERIREPTELRRQLDQLERRDQRKNEFIGQLAYELRNPLAPVHNAVHVLKIQPEPPDPGHVKWATDVIARQAQQLARLADDLRDVARMAHGGIKLSKEPIELGRALAQAIEAARPFTTARRQTVTYHPPVDFVHVEADPARLLQIVGKLLQYAGHCTPADGHIAVAAHREGDTAVISVTDDGVGIAPETLAHIFEPFQITRPVDEVPAGVGLGLALVQQLVHLHGGSVQMRSDGLGKGSAYTVRLPALPQAPATLPAVPPARADVESGWRILIVDDDRDVAQSFALLLSLMGHDVLAVNDGTAALRALPMFQPQIAFVDIGLPDMDGFELARLLRAARPPVKLRLVALTGYGHEEVGQRAAAAGFDRLLLKPVAADTVEQLLASYRAQ